ncbi:hypothetical protein [Mycobacteroides chelonae]|uniref:Transmembrane protein n=1 Tax=Mycobacteroides chelonae TaxID=1774 RepID=A0A1S1M9U1_MYCCH|nr:hypothetical protein [Mycobacteroides chelonae]OHU80132.1 hypothetical protein BKG84_18780 [Mycobacteroides chelonae]QQG88817.1 hypothetical protein HBA99_17595 [Mycobacteroides chelonae]QQG93631.1 hypothetical protein HBA97_17595 [Mycobacteroides chelonae]
MTTLIFAADQADKGSELAALVAFVFSSGVLGSIVGIGSYEMLADLAARHSKYTRWLAFCCFLVAFCALAFGVGAGVISAFTGQFDGRTYLALGGPTLGGFAYALNKYSAGQSDRHALERSRMIAELTAERLATHEAEMAIDERQAKARIMDIEMAKAELDLQRASLELERASLDLEQKRKQLGLSESPDDSDRS